MGIGKNPDVIAEMLNDRDGIWQITEERIKEIKNKIGSVPKSLEPFAIEMIRIAESSERFWVKKSEYYQVLKEMQRSSLGPGRSEISEAIEKIKEGAQRDRVAHREWVSYAINILGRISSR